MFKSYHNGNIFYDYLYNFSDHVAVPQYQGAMENWGLVPYSEILLLVDNLTSTIAQSTEVAQVIAHETAHLVSEEFLCRNLKEKLHTEIYTTNNITSS